MIKFLHDLIGFPHVLEELRIFPLADLDCILFIGIKLDAFIDN